MLVTAVYDDLRPNVSLVEQSLFERPQTVAPQLPYGNRRAWLEQVKFIFPVKFQEIAA